MRSSIHRCGAKVGVVGEVGSGLVFSRSRGACDFAHPAPNALRIYSCHGVHRNSKPPINAGCNRVEV